VDDAVNHTTTLATTHSTMLMASKVKTSPFSDRQTVKLNHELVPNMQAYMLHYFCDQLLRGKWHTYTHLA